MTRSSTTTRSLTYLIALGDVARRQALHDSCVVVGLLEAMSMVLTVKNLVIFKVVKGLAPWASVWCGGECPNSYPLKPLTGGSYVILAGSLYTSPYKNTWGESLHRCAYILSPADTRLSPQHWLGAAGCDSRAGLVRFTHAQANHELGHGGNERVCVWHIEP